MKEFKLIDEVMPDAPLADPARTAGIRAGVLNGGRQPRRRSTARFGVRLGWVIAAVATAAVVVTVTVLPRLEVAPSSPAVGPRADLEIAADLMAGRTEPDSGRYWRTVTEVTRRLKVGKSYFVDESDRRTTWLSSTDLPKVAERRLIGIKPVTAADLAKWKRAGSPELCESGEDCAGGSMRPGQTEYLSSSEQRMKYLRNGLLGADLNMLGFMRLPDDPVALRSELLGSWSASPAITIWAGEKPVTGERPVMTRDEWLWVVGTSILDEAPSSPAVRAALYRMLADVPGARVLGDERTVTVARAFQNGFIDHHVVIDRATGELSAIRRVLLKPDPQQKGYLTDFRGLPQKSVIFEVVFLAMGWTDEAPVLPEGCERRRCVR
ncbi:hypothetical protein ACIBF6_20370 [Streptosporangium amethystogenes]|uniref:hypothetical protein n=1 Tax=Streptosporangium amethystogenes TaxID=2002 RepID=UPI0037939569